MALEGFTGLEPAAGLVIEPDTFDEDDNDSAYGRDESSSLVSLSSAITEYVYKNGRRYANYGSGQHILPNDEMECDRHDFLQHIFGMLFGGRLVFAPIDTNPSRILDIGTGTGLWAIDVAQMYPSAEVIGTDVSPIQPSWVPPNLSFQVDDAELDWTFSRKFDLIHFQGLNGCIRDWKRLLLQAYENILPGGYLEAKETDVYTRSDDDSIPHDTSLREWEKHCIQACASIGQQLTVPEHLKAWMTEIGFVDVEERQFKLPINGWPKNEELKLIGRYQNAQYLEALSPFALGLLVEVAGWSREEMEAFLVNVRKDISNKRFHAYNIVRVITGRKPLVKEDELRG